MIAFIWQHDWEILGSTFAQRLIDAGHELTVCVRNGQSGAGASKVALPQGARQAKSLTAAVKGADVILTLLSTPQEVEDAYLGTGGIFEKAAPASLFIDLSTSSPRLAKELYALAAVHDHSFVEAPFEGDIEALGASVAETNVEGVAAAADVEGVVNAKDVADKPASEHGIESEPARFRILAAGEPDNLEKALPLLRILTPRVVEVGLPGSATTLKLASQIALAGAVMGVVEAVTFATVAGVEKEHILEIVNQGVAASTVTRAFGRRILDEDFYYGCDLRLFFDDLTCALDAADELELALPGLETAHQLYDLLVLVGGGQKGIHALTLIYYDEVRCAQHGLNWELAQRAMDVYERANDGYGDYDYDYDDDDECDDPDCDHPHHHYHQYDEGDEGGRPSMSGFFSPN